MFIASKSSKLERFNNRRVKSCYIVDGVGKQKMCTATEEKHDRSFVNI